MTTSIMERPGSGASMRRVDLKNGKRYSGPRSHQQRNFMKKQSQSAIVLGLCAGAALCVNSAHAQSDHVYIRADAGGVVTMDTRVKEFFGPVPSGTRVELDPGVRFGFTGGFQVTDWLAVEGQTGIFANRIKSISGADIG